MTVVPPGSGKTLIAPGQHVTFKVTGGQSAYASTFEVLVPPGFDVGAHVHAHSEELFYVLEGELDLFAFEPTQRTRSHWQAWESADGQRVVRAGAGSLMHVPPGCPHAFSNPGRTPARVLFQASPPPDHEQYFEELLEILSTGEADLDAIARLRKRYDVEQLTPLSPGPGWDFS